MNQDTRHDDRASILCVVLRVPCPGGPPAEVCLTLDSGTIDLRFEQVANGTRVVARLGRAIEEQDVQAAPVAETFVGRFAARANDRGQKR